MPPKKNKSSTTELVEVMKCYDCLKSKVLKEFDFKDKEKGTRWKACKDCRKDQQLDRKIDKRNAAIAAGQMVCTKCKKSKSIDLFTPKKNSGYYVQCTECRTALGK